MHEVIFNRAVPLIHVLACSWASCWRKIRWVMFSQMSFDSLHNHGERGPQEKSRWFAPIASCWAPCTIPATLVVGIALAYTAEHSRSCRRAAFHLCCYRWCRVWLFLELETPSGRVKGPLCVVPHSWLPSFVCIEWSPVVWVPRGQLRTDSFFFYLIHCVHCLPLIFYLISVSLRQSLVNMMMSWKGWKLNSWQSSHIRHNIQSQTE